MATSANPFAAGHAAQTLTVAQLVERNKEETVTMLFPKEVVLALSPNERVYFGEGPQEVPKSRADHWWLKSSGAKVYEKPVVAPPVKVVVLGEGHVQFLNARGYQVKSVAEAQAFYERIEDAEKSGFLADAGEWFQQKWLAKQAEVPVPASSKPSEPAKPEKEAKKAPIADQAGD